MTIDPNEPAPTTGGMPEGCPETAAFSEMWGFNWSNEPIEGETTIEIHPTGTRERLTELERVLGRILNELPTRRDWLDPDLERDARALSKEGGR